MKAINSTALLKNWHWFLLPALYCAARFTLLYFSPHSLYRFEELYQGYLGSEFLRGLQSSFWDYQIDPYSGGSLIVGALAAVSFKLFGNSLFALKLVPLFFSFLTLLTVMGFLQRFFGKRAAVYGGALMTFPAPALVSLSVIAIGSHPESRLFAAGTVWCFYEICFAKTYSKWPRFLFGFLGAVSLWFSGINLVILISCAATWKLLGRNKVVFRTALWIAAGIFLGATPWLASNIAHGFESVPFFLKTFSFENFQQSKEFFLSYPAEVIRLAAIEMPASLSLFHPNAALNHFFSLAYTCLVLLLVINAIHLSVRAPEPGIADCGGRSREKLLFFAVFPAVFFLLITFISLRVNWHGETLPYRFRYFALFYLYLCILAAILGSLRKKIALLAVLPMIIIGLSGFLMLLKPENAGRLLRVPGYSIETPRYAWQSHTLPKMFWLHKSWEELMLDQHLFLKVIYDAAFWDSVDYATLEDKLAKLPPRLAYYFVNLAGSHAADIEPFPVFKVPDWLPESQVSLYAYGFTNGLDWDLFMRNPERIPGIFQSFPNEYRHWFLLRYAKNIFIWDSQSFILEFPEDGTGSLLKNLAPEDLKWVYRGVGTGFLRHFPNLYPLQTHPEKIFSKIPQAYRDDFLWGLGWNLRGRRAGYDQAWLQEQVKNLPDAVQTPIKKGFEAYEDEWYRHPAGEEAQNVKTAG